MGVEKENPDFMKLISSTNHPERFVLFGERRDVGSCLRAFDVFCLHSLNEGFPNSLGEAMAVGLPCVATDVGDVSLLIGDTGIVVESRNSRALADALIAAIRLGVEEQQRMGRKARARIETEFSMMRAGQKFSRVYDMLCSEADVQGKEC
jgi:glycosyltransferase involved in cell wall biosynthesis